MAAELREMFFDGPKVVHLFRSAGVAKWKQP